MVTRGEPSCLTARAGLKSPPSDGTAFSGLLRSPRPLRSFSLLIPPRPPMPPARPQPQSLQSLPYKATAT